MTGREHALQLLAQAGESDRRWIIQRLSGAARARISGTAHAPANASETTAAPAARAQMPMADAVAALEAADPARMIELLRAEPGWLIAPLLRVREWPWGRKFLEALPSHVRAEIVHLGRFPLTLPPAALQFLIRALAAQLDGPMRAPVRHSRFDSLLARARRSRER